MRRGPCICIPRSISFGLNGGCVEGTCSGNGRSLGSIRSRICGRILSFVLLLHNLLDSVFCPTLLFHMAKFVAKGALRTRLLTIIRKGLWVGSGRQDCRCSRWGQTPIIVHVSETSDDFLFVKDIQNRDSANYVSKIMGKGSDYGHCSELIIEIVQGKCLGCQRLDNSDLLVDSIDQTVQGLVLLLLNRQERLVGIKTRSSALLDEGILQG